MKDNVFVIGDVHGHLDRLVALLNKAGFIDSRGGFTSLTREVEVIQLGDLGHYGADTRQNDLAVWTYAASCPWLKVLWGNHDMSVFRTDHTFRGYTEPDSRTRRLMEEKGLLFSTVRHGYLLTHAGLHPSYVPLSADAAAQAYVDRTKFMSTLINLTCEGASLPVPIRDDIASYRGGWAQQGGILWRDYREPLADIPQVYGHSRSYDIRQDGNCWCIDVADREGDSLAGIWLPSMKVVAVGADARFIEQSGEDL